MKQFPSIFLLLFLTACHTSSSSNSENLDAEVSSVLLECKKDRDCSADKVCNSGVCQSGVLNSTTMISVIEKIETPKSLEACDADDSRLKVQQWYPKAIDEDKGFWSTSPTVKSGDIVFVDFKSQLKNAEYRCDADKYNSRGRFTMAFAQNIDDPSAGGLYISISGNSFTEKKSCRFSGFYSSSSSTTEEGWKELDLKGEQSNKIVDSGNYCLLSEGASLAYN